MNANVITINAFTKGIAPTLDPAIAGANGIPVIAENCALDDGALKGIYGPGTAIATMATARKTIFYEDSTWRGLTTETAEGLTGWVLHDVEIGAYAAPVVIAADYDAFSSLAIYKDGVPSTPGVSPPGVAPAYASATGAGQIVCAWTYAAEELSGELIFESNPSPLSAADDGGGTLTFTGAAPDSRVTHYYVYATAEGNSSGTLYFVKKVATGTLSTTINVTPDPTIPLEWRAGGRLSAIDGFYYDHSPGVEIATVLSDKLHGSEAAAAGQAGSTLFYAGRQIVRWAQSGNFRYHPVVNYYPLPSIVQAMISRGSQTFAFLVDAIWAFSGADSTAIGVSQTASRIGVRVRCGKTVKDTPYGIIFLSAEGPAVFDGANAQLLAPDVFEPLDFDAAAHWVAAYQDGIYYLGSSEIAYCYRIDLRQPGGVSVTTVDFAATYFYQHPSVSSAIDEGLYVYDGTTGTVKPWREGKATGVAGAAQRTATWRSGYLVLGRAARQSRVRLFRVEGEGTVTVRFFVNNDTPEAGVATWEKTVDAGSLRHFKVPQNIKGRHFQVELEVPAGSTLRKLEIEGVAA